MVTENAQAASECVAAQCRMESVTICTADEALRAVSALQEMATSPHRMLGKMPHGSFRLAAAPPESQDGARLPSSGPCAVQWPLPTPAATTDSNGSDVSTEACSEAGQLASGAHKAGPDASVSSGCSSSPPSTSTSPTPEFAPHAAPAALLPRIQPLPPSSATVVEAHDPCAEGLKQTRRRQRHPQPNELQAGTLGSETGSPRTRSSDATAVETSPPQVELEQVDELPKSELAREDLPARKRWRANEAPRLAVCLSSLRERPNT